VNGRPFDLAIRRTSLSEHAQIEILPACAGSRGNVSLAEYVGMSWPATMLEVDHLTQWLALVALDLQSWIEWQRQDHRCAAGARWVSEPVSIVDDARNVIGVEGGTPVLQCDEICEIYADDLMSDDPGILPALSIYVPKNRERTWTARIKESLTRTENVTERYNT
jgi:hypothetical protein